MSADAKTTLDPILFCDRCGARIEQTGVRQLQSRIDQGDKVVCPQCAPKQTKRYGGSGFVIAPSARLSRGYDPDAPTKRPTPLLHLLAGIGLATTTAFVVILLWFAVRAAIQGGAPKSPEKPPPATAKERL
jgi:hypothetical protein